MLKVNASVSESNYVKYIGVGVFKVLGVNPTKAELEKFFNREVNAEPEYITPVTDDKDNKPYKRLRLTFMVEANPVNKENKPIKCNAGLKNVFKSTLNFFLESRYCFNRDKSKVKVIDIYGRTAWVTIEQAKNHQIPVYVNGPAHLDVKYRPMYKGEDLLLNFLINYFNVNPIEIYNKTTNTFELNSNPSDCEAQLEHIQDYFKGDISEIKDNCALVPDNEVKLLVGVQTTDEGNQYNTIFNRASARANSNSYKVFSKALKEMEGYLNNTVYSDASDGSISNIHEYVENVTPTNLEAPAEMDPFAEAAALPDDDNDLPFE